jgi:hypothetical protein
MSANSSSTNVGSLSDHPLPQLVIEKIESQRAAGEYSPAGSTAANSCAPSLVDQEKAIPPETQPITHRPTGFRVRAS